MKRSHIASAAARALLALLGAACVAAPAPAQAEPLYFALEVRHEGHVVAQPRFLGATGRTLRAERRAPHAAQADYRLVLTPRRTGERFLVELDLALPEAQGHRALALAHGQQRRFQLGRFQGELEVSLLVMRVDSPEFRALMELGERDEAGAPASM